MSSSLLHVQLVSNNGINLITFYQFGKGLNKEAINMKIGHLQDGVLCILHPLLVTKKVLVMDGKRD